MNVNDQDCKTVEHVECDSFVVVASQRHMSGPSFHSGVHLRCDPIECVIFALKLREIADQVEGQIPKKLLRVLKRSYRKSLREEKRSKILEEEK